MILQSRIWPLFLFLLLANIFPFCKTKTISEKPHHTSGGFKNPNPNFESKGLSNVLVWQWERRKLTHSVNPIDYSEFPVLINDGLRLRNNESALSVTWIGHASTLIQMDGVNILTDPIWSDRCSPVSFLGPKRYTPPGITMDNLPKIHAVILSHNHYDHMDLPSLKEIQDRFHPVFYAGMGNKKFLNDNGITSVREFDWWEFDFIQGIKVNFTPTQHFSGRGLFDRDETLWGSYVLEGKSKSVYFAGDTGYYSHFSEIGKKWPGIEVAILPIGAYEPRWFMAPVHVDPEEAAQAFQDLGAKYMVPMHYMTFVLSDEKLDIPVPTAFKALEKLGKPKESLVPLKIGETRFF